MAQTNDTIDGLLAEFRGYSHGMPPSYHITMSWADFRRMLGRLDAAHRRERGDCAKLRKAALRQKELLQTIYSRGSVDRRELCAGMGLIDAALAAPPRNCDRPECATTKAAADVWRKEDGGKTAYHEWLLAPSTEKEGGAK